MFLNIREIKKMKFLNFCEKSYTFVTWKLLPTISMFLKTSELRYNVATDVLIMQHKCLRYILL